VLDKECGREIDPETKTCSQCGSDPTSDTALRAAARMITLRDHTIRTLAKDLASAEARIRAMWVALALVLAIVALVGILQTASR